MVLDLSGFVTKEQGWEGLSNLTNKLEYRKQQQAKAQEESNATKAASIKFFTNYLDDKAKFTGTKFDPYTHELTANALNNAMDLIKQGANNTEIMTAITPLVNKAIQYSLNAQQYAQNKKQQLELLKNVKGIDLQKVSDQMDKMAFEGKPIDQVDPTLNYADMALREGDVFTPEGFDEAYKNAKMNTTVGVVKNTDSKGRMNKSKVKLIGQDYLVSEKDADGNHVGFVPKYEIATDGGDPLIHKFETEQGNVDAPVRLLDRDLFDRLSKPEKAYVFQEARKYAKANNIDLSSKQAENFARAIAYDEKKSRQSGTFETVEEQKAAPAPRITIKVGDGMSKSEQAQAQSANDLKIALDSEPEESDGRINVSRYINGVTFLTNSKGKRISQPEVFFNPKDKTFTYTDDEGNDETVSFSKFKSIATPVNATGDLKFLEGFRSYKRDAAPQPEKKEEKKTGFVSTMKGWLQKGKEALAPKAKEMTLAEKMKAAQKKQ